MHALPPSIRVDPSLKVGIFNESAQLFLGTGPAIDLTVKTATALFSASELLSDLRHAPPRDSAIHPCVSPPLLTYTTLIGWQIFAGSYADILISPSGKTWPWTALP